MKLLLATVGFTLLSEALAAPSLDKRGGPLLRRAPAYDPLRKRDFAHLDEIGVPFPHLVRHIQEKYPNHNLISERTVYPGLGENRTLVRYDISDDLWHEAVSTYPLDKREEHLVKRSLAPPPLTHSSADGLSKRSAAYTGYTEIRNCNPQSVAVKNDQYMSSVRFFCNIFDETVKLKMDIAGPDPVENYVFGPWATGTDQGHDAQGVKAVDWYFNFDRADTFPWDKIFLLCRERLGQLTSCVRPGNTSGGKAGFSSKLGEGMAFWYMAPDPPFLQKNFATG
ncbi:hypothetical protein ABW21_db0203776 [Orbilia brochopaga]|nr:hypothetical protein ABW21_db0203776 [Drechslerella brochopaga]